MSKESALQMLGPTPTPPQPPLTPNVDGAQTNGEVKEQPKEIDKASFDQLAKKEAELVKDRLAYKAELAAFQQEKERLLGAEKRIKEFDELKQKDAVAAMKLAGFNDTDILNYYASLEDKSTPEEKAAKVVQAEIKKFKDEIAEKEQKQFKQEIDARVVAFNTSIKSALTAEPDKYEYCNYYGPEAELLVKATTAELVKSDNIDLKDPEQREKYAKEALQLVEEYFENRDKEMEKLKKRESYRGTRTEVEKNPQKPADVVEPLKAEVSPGQPNKAPKTLTNKATATVASTIPNRKETPSEKRERLMEKLRNIGKA